MEKQGDIHPMRWTQWLITTRPIINTSNLSKLSPLLFRRRHRQSNGRQNWVLTAIAVHQTVWHQGDTTNRPAITVNSRIICHIIRTRHTLRYINRENTRCWLIWRKCIVPVLNTRAIRHYFKVRQLTESLLFRRQFLQVIIRSIFQTVSPNKTQIWSASANRPQTQTN